MKKTITPIADGTAKHSFTADPKDLTGKTARDEIIYYFCKRNLIFKTVKTTEEYINMLHDYKQEQASEYGIERMGIFGSVARGEQTEDSDLDIYLESATITLFRMGGLLSDLKDLFHTKVDIVCKHDRLNPKLLQRINKDIIYV